MIVCTAGTNARNWENVGKELTIQQGWGGGELFEAIAIMQARHDLLNI